METCKEIIRRLPDGIFESCGNPLPCPIHVKETGFMVSATLYRGVDDKERMYFVIKCCPTHYIYSFERLCQHLSDKHDHSRLMFNFSNCEVWSK